MNNGIRWAVIIGALALAIGVGAFAYNAGLAQGIEQSGKIVAAPGAAYPYYYGWHRPFGFGFLFGPIFFVAFWIFVMRAIFGGHRWRGRCGDRMFDERHRRAHEQMWNEPRKEAPSQQ
ncbi:MAG: hypothetical protein JWO97_1182 [Acidobacteria bacterium]|nr:hypothetical protein [Acidobacteriota bacterium]